MPTDLREYLLKWYFDRSPGGVTHPPATTPEPSAADTGVPRREERGRVSFPEFLRAGLLAPGDQLVCKTLKRQQRGGEEQFIDAGKVLADGRVEYRGRGYDVPSKLAVEVVNTNGGKTDALNGYDYLMVRSSNGRRVPLKKLRDRLIRGNT
jgi:hypothetical protein